MSFFKKLFGSSDSKTENKEVNTDKLVRKLLDKADSERINDDYEEVSAIYKEAHSLQPDNAEVLIAWAEYAKDKAIEEQNSEWLNQSIELFEKAYALDSENAELLNNWAYALYVKANDTNNHLIIENEVLPKYEKAAEIDPDNTEIIYEWADALHKISQATKDPARLRQTIEKCREIANLPYKDDLEKMDRIETFFWMTDAIGNLAIIENSNDLLNKLNDTYAEALSLYKDHHQESFYTKWISDLSSVIYQMKSVDSFDMCYDLCKKALKEFPNSPSLYYVWAQTKSYEAKLSDDDTLYQDVFGLYRQTEKMAPNNKQVLYSWAMAILQLARETKDEDLYKECFDKFEQMTQGDNGKDPQLYQQWAATLLLYANDMDKLEESKERIEELAMKAESITEGSGAYFLLQLQVLLDDTEQALEWMEKALKYDYEYYIKEIENNPLLEGLRNHSRYEGVREKYNLK